MRDTFKIFPPTVSPYAAMEVMRAYGLVEVHWPSGRRTLEQYAANVVTSNLELAMARNSTDLRLAKEHNLKMSMVDFQRSTHARGYFIRTKRRRKARKVDTVTWIHPDRYAGPIPDAHGVLP